MCKCFCGICGELQAKTNISDTAARNRTVSFILGLGQVERMIEDVLRWFRNARVDVVHNPGSFGIEAGPCDTVKRNLAQTADTSSP